jgi:iron complex transport system substrate-binding protein
MSLLTCNAPRQPQNQSIDNARRIISFAPSITETLFALGVGERVVGVTSYCTYPSSVRSLPKIGGFLDPNFEAVLRLKPDLVVLLKEHQTVMSFLAVNHIPAVAIDNHNIEAILGSFEQLGRLFSKQKPADSLIADVRSQIKPARENALHPRVLICVGRNNPGSGTISSVYAAGPSTFYGELLAMAGGTNVFPDTIPQYPTFSTEAILRFAPDIIIDIAGTMQSIQKDVLQNDWSCLAGLPAVRDSMVFCFSGDYCTIPGPRVSWVLRDIRTAIDSWCTAKEVAHAAD